MNKKLKKAIEERVRELERTGTLTHDAARRVLHVLAEEFPEKRMRKSEFEKRAGEIMAGGRTGSYPLFVALAEEAGVEWEPEPVELPERLEILGDRPAHVTPAVLLSGPGLYLSVQGFGPHSEDESLARAFVARWNANEALRRGLEKLINRLNTPMVDGSYPRAYGMDLEHLLDAADRPELERKPSCER